MMPGISQQISLRLKAGIAILLFLVGVQYILVPIIQWRNGIVHQVISLQQSIAHKKAFIGMEGQIESVYKDHIAQRDQWYRYFEANLADSKGLQLKLQKKVEEETAKLNIKTVNVDWLPATKGEIIRAPVKFRLECTPEQFMNLLFDMEQQPYFVSIDHINIGARHQSDTFAAELDVSAYGLSEALSKQ